MYIHRSRYGRMLLWNSRYGRKICTYRDMDIGRSVLTTRLVDSFSGVCHFFGLGECFCEGVYKVIKGVNINLDNDCWWWEGGKMVFTLWH